MQRNILIQLDHKEKWCTLQFEKIHGSIKMEMVSFPGLIRVSNAYRAKEDGVLGGVLDDDDVEDGDADIIVEGEDDPVLQEFDDGKGYVLG